MVLKIKLPSADKKFMKVYGEGEFRWIRSYGIEGNPFARCQIGDRREEAGILGLWGSVIFFRKQKTEGLQDNEV